MSTEVIDKQPPTPKKLSHLFRIFAEKNMTDERLNRLVQLGFLEDLFSVPLEELNQVHRGNLKRVMRIISPPQVPRFHFFADYKTPLDRLLGKAGIYSVDGRHNEILVGSELNGEMAGVIRQVKGSRYGAVMREHEKNGEKAATLHELVSFARHVPIRTFGRVPIFALGTRLSNVHPQRSEVFYLQETVQGNIYLRHVNSYSEFPPDARFLGVSIP